MSKLVAISRQDGGVSIMRLLDDGLDVDAEVQKWIESSPGQYASHRETAPAELPGDMDTDPFRGAWADKAGKLGHDMPRAREIHKQRLRIERAPLLAELDVEYIRAQETNDNGKRAQVTARKQALRDITADQRFATAATVADLMEIRLP